MIYCLRLLPLEASTMAVLLVALKSSLKGYDLSNKFGNITLWSPANKVNYAVCSF